jgi:2-polyprenyl-6-methoxyphenol hydroxylase-like FAD-dependent oxidoreductase
MMCPSLTDEVAAAGTGQGGRFDADVVVVGAGPVGLVLAADLADRGASVIVAEQRAYLEAPNVKCNHVSARTMEGLRRLGLADKVRAAGLPADHPHDIAFRTAVTGTEFARIKIPCRRDRFTATDGADSWWPTPELPHRINQTFLEPILAEHVAAQPGVTLLNRVRYREFTQGDDGVLVTIEDIEAGLPRTLRSRFLIGCDGARSDVRRQIGARLSGTEVIQRVQSTCIRAPQLAPLLSGERAWGYYSVNTARCGTVFSIDGNGTYLVHNHLNHGEGDFDSIDRDASIRTILGVGGDFDYEVVSKEDWTGRRLVADRFRDGRVFICGDASHLWVPYAGYGMNAGIADAFNLSWALAAVLDGWADPGILDAYQAERQPITEQVSRLAMEHALKMMAARGAVPEGLADEGPEADALRAETGRFYYELNVPQFAAAGLNFGYFYEGSPVIAYDGEAAPGYTMGTFTSSTVPGCRAPHFWLSGGKSLYDAFGPGYTLLRLHREADTGPFESAMAERGVPLTVLDIEPGTAPEEYRHALVLCRADQHVAWRGDRLPQDVSALVGRLRGAAQA